MSRRTLTRHFAKATGMGIADWLAAERLRSQILLEAGIYRSGRWRRSGLSLRRNLAPAV